MPDINTLAAWGEFIGGIAVVVSLVYLASQIRQNSKLLRASTAAIRKESLTAPAILQAQDAGLARIFEEGRADRGALSEDDRRRFDCLMTIMFAANNQHYEFVRDGLTTPDAGGEMDNLMLFLVTQPGARHWWREWKTIFPDAFRNHTDGLIREGEAAE